MFKSYKYRIKLNNKQKEIVSKTFGCTRFVYNYYLTKNEETYKLTGKGLSYKEFSKDLTLLKKEKIWLKEVDSTALQTTLRYLSDAYKNFFNKTGDHPIFHKKKNYASYTTKNNHDSIKILDEKHLQIPILGKVYFYNSRSIKGKILSATISRKPSGKYYVSINFKCEDELSLPKTNKSAGIDLGLKSFAMLSDGTNISPFKVDEKLEKRLLKEERKLSRMIKANIESYDKNRKPRFKRPLNECKNLQKQRIKVARLHEKIANKRTDYVQKLSTKLIRKYDVISIEDLNVEGMLKNHHLAKSIQEASWSEFVRLLEYKASWYGKTIQKVDRFFASSKTCSVCGFKKIDLQLKDRSWTCPNCKSILNRDLNAAININFEGLRLQRV